MTQETLKQFIQESLARGYPHSTRFKSKSEEVILIKGDSVEIKEVNNSFIVFTPEHKIELQTLKIDFGTSPFPGSCNKKTLFKILPPEVDFFKTFIREVIEEGGEVLFRYNRESRSNKLNKQTLGESNYAPEDISIVHHENSFILLLGELIVFSLAMPVVFQGCKIKRR